MRELVFDVPAVDVSIVTHAAAVRSDKSEYFIPTHHVAVVFDLVCAQLLASVVLKKGGRPGRNVKPSPPWPSLDSGIIELAWSLPSQSPINRDGSQYGAAIESHRWQPLFVRIANPLTPTNLSPFMQLSIHVVCMSCSLLNEFGVMSADRIEHELHNLARCT